MLISSLPPVHQAGLLKAIIENPTVEAVRYNTGMSSAYSPYETIKRIKALADPAKKPVYIDLKGRQLRVIEWANLPEGPILLNHRIQVELPADVYFRGDDRCALREVVRGNEIYVDPLPKAPVGRGQSVNIISKNLTVEGGLLDLDHEYIKAGLNQGITNFMLSFVESKENVEELEEAIARHSYGSKSIDDCKVVFKIESQAGVEFVGRLERKNFVDESPYRLMAARDDLRIEIGLLNVMEALKLITDRDPEAICASRLLLGLERGDVSLADLSDIEYMRLIGYKHFMLSDEISREHSEKAFAFWQEYCLARPFTA
ncbi:hypothetical protein HYT05_00990 [Candidatus Kaiserbacteria bacterium]|nr:hypothetical protein [Candidatus Kaiserbacteria bacterium]